MDYNIIFRNCQSLNYFILYYNIRILSILSGEHWRIVKRNLVKKGRVVEDLSGLSKPVMKDVAAQVATILEGCARVESVKTRLKRRNVTVEWKFERPLSTLAAAKVEENARRALSEAVDILALRMYHSEMILADQKRRSIERREGRASTAV